MRLKAKKSKGRYKSTDAWINAIYRNNKDIIDSKLNGIGTVSERTLFKNLIKEYIKKGYTPTQALSKLTKSTIFTPEGERLKNNAYNALRADKEAYKKFRELTKVNGRYTKIDWSKMKWDKYSQTYFYDDTVSISFRNSPYAVIVGV